MIIPESRPFRNRTLQEHFQQMAAKTLGNSTSSRSKLDKGTHAQDDGAHTSAEKPVSLRPLKFEDALRGLFKVEPDQKGKRDGAGK